MSYQKKLTLIHYLVGALVAAILAFTIRTFNRANELEYNNAQLSADLTHVAAECRVLQSENARLREYIELNGGES